MSFKTPSRHSAGCFFWGQFQAGATIFVRSGCSLRCSVALKGASTQPGAKCEDMFWQVFGESASPLKHLLMSKWFFHQTYNRVDLLLREDQARCGGVKQHRPCREICHLLPSTRFQGPFFLLWTTALRGCFCFQWLA